MLGQEVLTPYVRSCSGEIGGSFAIYRIWAIFVAFWSVLLHCRQHNWCLWIYTTHIQLLWGQGHGRSQVPWAVSVAHFSSYNSNLTAVLNVGVIV